LGIASPKKKRNENWEIDGDTYISAIKIASNVGAFPALRHKRSMSESALPVFQGKEKMAGNVTVRKIGASVWECGIENQI
jgi:hypothetical protein